jgi:enterobactin synthetase component D / holo-[acyl-carrier protein] synthase
MQMVISNRLSETLASMLPSDIACAGGTLDANVDELFDVEKRAIQAAVRKRRREFASGRSYARKALIELGCPAQPLPVGSAREVIWPYGFIGSISHSDESCAAIVARTDSYCGIGLDLESDRPIEDHDMRALICRPEERSITWSEGDPSKLLFVIKEAVFKAYYPGARVYLDFDDLSVELESSRNFFRAQLMPMDAPPLAGKRSFTGTFRLWGGQLIATVVIPQPARMSV